MKTLILSLFVGLLALGGCAAGRTVEGKVVDGPAGIVLAADEKDSRIKGPGVGEATVQLRGRGAGDSERVIQEARTKPDGSFVLGFKGLTMHEDGVVVITRPGYAPVRGKFFIPPDGRTVLVVMRRTGGEGGNVPSSEHASVPEPTR